MIRTLAAALATTTCIIAYATPAAAQEREYNIPAGSLKQALDAYVKQSGRQVVYRADEVKSARSNGARGSFDAQDALSTILAGSGFTTRTDGQLIAIVKAGNAASVSSVSSSSGQEERDAQVEIVVTGTQIRGVTPSSPVRTVSRQEIENSGYLSTGDVIRSLPQAFAGNINPGVVGGAIFGTNLSLASSADLRGLGPDATLTLFEGNRLAYSGTLNTVDVSAIPLLAVRKIEVLTDGASTTYGSDAVAGVVNFLVRDRFEGIETVGRTGFATRGGASQQQIGAIAGPGWATGNAMFAAEYQHDEPLKGSSRSFTELLPDPYYLLPKQDRVSALATLRQETSFGAIDLNGLFTNRIVSARRTTAYSTVRYLDVSRTEAQQFFVNAAVHGGLAPSLDYRLSGTFSKSTEEYSDVTTGTTNAVYNYRTENALTSLEASFSGTLAALPAGPVRAAVGGGFRAEDEQNTILVSTRADRKIWYLFGEGRVPLIADGGFQLELSGSGRYEKYSDFGSVFTPKFGGVLRHDSGLGLRGTWGRSFRAPTLDQLGGSKSVFVYPATTLAIPATPAGAKVLFVTGANADLLPERATSWTAGVDFSPPSLAGLSLHATYFDISYKNRIGVGNFSVVGIYNNPLYEQFIIKNPDQPTIAQYVSTATLFRDLTGTTFNPDSVLAIYLRSAQNALSQDVRGVDFSLIYSSETTFGQFGLRGDATWLQTRQRDTATSPEREITGFIYRPRNWKLRASASLETGGLNTVLTLNYVGPGTDDSGLTKVGSTAFDTPIDAWTTLDLRLAYGLSDSPGGQAQTTFSLAITNLLDADPPYIAPSSNGLNFSGLGFESGNASALGRYVSLSVTRKW